jgi:hypothetical protein
MRHARLFVAVAGLVTVGVVGACTSDHATFTGSLTAPLFPAMVAKDSGDAQKDTVGHLLAVVPRIRVLNNNGDPLGDVLVRFVPSDPTTMLGRPTAYTDANGYATPMSWTLGHVAGMQTLVAIADTFTVTFVARALEDAPFQMTAIQGDGQTAPADAPVTTAPMVKVTDRFNNPVPSQNVIFSVGGGGGKVIGDSVLTNALGNAQTGVWTMGDTAGVQVLVAQIIGPVSPVRFVATATPRPLPPAPVGARLIVVTGNNQSGPTSSALSTVPTVLLTDSAGSPIAGRLVVFSTPSNSGHVATSAASTDANGMANSGTWTLGTNLGADSLIVTASAVPAVTFVATATVGPPARILLVNGGGQVGHVSAVLPTSPSVLVTDVAGDPLPGVLVVFAITSGGGSLTNGYTMTGPDGIATAGVWTLGPAVGAATLQASVTSIAPLVLNATIIP